MQRKELIAFESFLLRGVCIHLAKIAADTESENIFPRVLTPEVLQALRGVRFIAQHIKDADKDNEVIY